MTGIKRALGNFWNSFVMDGVQIHAYSEDVVPNFDADKDGNTVPLQFPYLLYKTEYPDFSGTLPTSVTAWFKLDPARPTAAMAQRAALCDAVSRAIPTQGIMLPVDTGGYLVLRRSTGTWMSEYTPDTTLNVIGARFGVEIMNCTLM